MAGSIEEGCEGVTVEVTRPARNAGLAVPVDDDSGELTGWDRLATVKVYAFDEMILVLDRERVDPGEIAELIVAASKDSESIHIGTDAELRSSGDKCVISLPGLTEREYGVGDDTVAHPGPEMLVLTKDSVDGAQKGENLIRIRREQKHE